MAADSPIDDLDDVMNLIDAQADEQDELLEQEDDDVESLVTTGQPASQRQAPATEDDDDLKVAVKRLADAELLREQRAQEERNREQQEVLEEQRREAEKEARKRLYDDDDVALTEEEEEIYSASRGVINKLVRNELREYHDKYIRPLSEGQQRLGNDVGSISQAARQTADQMLHQRLREEVPELDSFTQTQEWRDYLDEPMPELGTGVTRGSVLRSHVETFNADAAAHLIKGFRGASGTPKKSGAPTPSLSPGRANGAPASAAAAERRSRGDGQVVNYSRYLELAEQAKKGLIDPAKFDKITDFFLKKEEEGLVNMNA